MQKILFLLLILIVTPANGTNQTENTSSSNPVMQVIKQTLQVSGALGFLYGLSRWTISEKAGKKEIDSWIHSKNGHLKSTEKHQIIFFGGHGAGDVDPNPSQANMYFEKLLPFSPEEINKNVNFYAPGNRFGRRFLSLAQRWDVYQIEQNLRHILALKQNPQQKTILFAHCIGASTLISLLFQKPELANHLAGIVLYAPFADVADLEVITKYIPRRLCHKPLIKRCLQASIAPNYSCNAKSPIEWIASGSVRKDLPIILIHSNDDPMIPINHFYQIKNAFFSHEYHKFTAIRCFDKGHFPMDIGAQETRDISLLNQIRNIIRTQMFEFDEVSH